MGLQTSDPCARSLQLTGRKTVPFVPWSGRLEFRPAVPPRHLFLKFAGSVHLERLAKHCLDLGLLRTEQFGEDLRRVACLARVGSRSSICFDRTDRIDLVIDTIRLDASIDTNLAGLRLAGESTEPFPRAHGPDSAGGQVAQPILAPGMGFGPVRLTVYRTR